MKINLVHNGIFPIKGNLKEDSTGFKYPGTFQGEGKLIGTPCLFVRTSGCNLRCAWVGADGKGSPCDTPYSSHNPEKNQVEVQEVYQTLIDNNLENLRYLVISGGEPFMQSPALIELLELIRYNIAGIHITIETNATFFNTRLVELTDLVSMSPKLKSSTPWEANLKDTGIDYSEKWAEVHERKRINLTAIQKIIDERIHVGNDFQLKFVVACEDDLVEIEEMLALLTNFRPDDICLMPEGVTVAALESRTGWIAQEAIKRGWRFTPRLHINLFGKNRYV
jgi:7-carboxy-7-deazaguanine synthase